MVVVAVFAILTKTVASFKEVVVARAFGRGDSLDAFLIAFLLPSFVVSLLIGALDSALVPVLVDTRQKEGTRGAQDLLSSMMLLCILGLIAVALLLGLFAPYYLPLVAHAFSASKLHLTRQLLYVLLPFIVFSGFSIFVSSVLTTHERFGLPSAISMTTPLVIIGFISVAALKWGPFALAAGTLTGSFLEAAFLYCLLKRQGLRFSLKWNVGGQAERKVLGTYTPMLAAGFLMGSTALVDQSMAAMLAGGSVAALSYANKVVGAIVAIGGTSLNSASLPYFSEMVSENDWAACRHTLKRYSILIACVTIPFTLLLIAFSRPLISFLFQRGAFTSSDTVLVSWVQACYAVQIPFYIWSMLFIRFLCAIRKNEVLMYLAAVNLVLDVTFNLVLMRVWGVTGIALSTSLVYLVSCAFVVIYSFRVLKEDRVSSVAGIPAGGTTP